jgi:hypothetical protein
MILRQNDRVVVSAKDGGHTIVRISDVEHRWDGTFYSIEGYPGRYNESIFDLDKTKELKREERLHNLLDGCHSI